MYYIDYERIKHHKSMLSDRERTLAFKRAIEKCVNRGDVVVDIGCGTGILSFFAAKKGAKVYAIERTEIINLAKKIAKENDLDIKFICADSSEVKLQEKCDVIVSDCIGYFALQENMITDVINFKRKYLKGKGKIIPNKIKMFLSLVNSSKAYEEVNFWKRNYGFNFLPARELAANSTYHVEINRKDLLSNSPLVKEINLSSDESVEFDKNVLLKVKKDGIAYGLCGYFDAELYKGINLSNIPGNKTHWKQEFFPFKKSFKVKRGQEIEVNIKADLYKAFVDWEWKVLNNIQSTNYGTRLKDKKFCNVVAFILFRNGKILVEERLPTKIDPEKIVIPGGHVKKGENLITACKRELKEELDVNCENFEFVCKSLHDAGSEFQMIHYFLCKGWKGGIKVKEAKRVFWLDVKNLNKLSYQIDRNAIEKIIK